MSFFSGLNRELLDFLIRSTGASPETQQELTNFLTGRITTVTDETEFGGALKNITQDAEGVGAGENVSVLGEVVGAIEGGGLVGLEGGLIIEKGKEIISELSTLFKGTQDETNSRSDSAERTRNISNRGVIHGSNGIPTRDPQVLIERIKNSQRSARKRGEVPKARTFRGGDPEGGLRQRGRKPVVDEFPDDGGPQDDNKEEFVDVELGDPASDDVLDDDISDPQSKNRRPIGDPPPERFPPIPPFPLFIKPGPAFAGRRPGKDAGDKNTDDNSVNDDSLEKQSSGWLRPEFKMLGTEYFNKKYGLTPLKTQNSEWTEFNYVNEFDRQNFIEIDNAFSDKIRFSKPFFMPKFIPKKEPPSNKIIYLKRIPMTKQYQLSQPFKNKFDSADMGRKMELTETYNHSVFDTNFKNLKIYNPI